MPVHTDKLEGKRKVQALVAALALAVVLFATSFHEGGHIGTPRTISDVRVGQDLTWNETVMECTLTVYNITSVVEPSPYDTRLDESENLCGTLRCKSTSPVVDQGREELYTCFSARDIFKKL